MSDQEWRERAERVIAAGASTGSKRPPTMFGAEHRGAPSHFVRALGARPADLVPRSSDARWVWDRLRARVRRPAVTT